MEAGHRRLCEALNQEAIGQATVKEHMGAEDEILIRVQRDWDGWRTGEVRLAELESVHWFQPGRAPRPLLHGSRG
jgi:hypothetical protein